mgnify:FL=1
MKTLYLIGGPMGVGKTTVCRLLKKELDRAVFLDGDWCWDADPFVVNDETKAMVLDNICHVLNNFLSCTAYENVIFCWVMHEQGIIDAIQSALRLQDCRVITISLVCRRDILVSRLEKDICGGLRQPDVIGRSLARLTCYAGLDTLKLDVSDQTPEQAARLIAKL